MAESELLDAREAMQILGINEGDLQTLVARGDLRAFRSAGTMKFRRDDVSSLKQEKATEPTIIIPAASSRKQGASGILPTVGGGQSKPGSRIIPAVAPIEQPAASSQTSDIVLDDIELSPMDAGATQQVTIAQSAIRDPIGGQTVVDHAHGGQTGSMTVVEGGIEPTTGPQPAVSGSGRRTAVGSGVQGAPQVATPAMSRVRAAVAPGVSMATSKRTLAVYQAKPASPIWTGVMILTSIVLVNAMSICAVMMTKGSYDPVSGERIIPPFLAEGNPFNYYQSAYDKTPGQPRDPRPKTEFGPKQDQ